MRTRIIFSLLALAGFASTFAVNAQAQTTVTSTATITSPITGAALNLLDFGTAAKGSLNSVTASGGVGAAKVYFSGDELDNITISVPASLTISTTSGSGASMTVNLTRENMRANTVTDVAGWSIINASSGTANIPLSADAGGDGVDADGLGQAYVWLGGTVTPDAHQQRGTYSGTFQITASYQN